MVDVRRCAIISLLWEKLFGTREGDGSGNRSGLQQLAADTSSVTWSSLSHSLEPSTKSLDT